MLSGAYRRLPVLRVVLLLLAGLIAAGPLAAQTPAPSEEDRQLQQAIAKSNAYIGLMNRTLRAVQSWERYQSWVRSPAGPTGRERIVYGLYGLYDVRGEIEKAQAMLGQPPEAPELDAIVGRYIAVYQVLAPVVGEAEGYYERKDYLADNWAGGKAIHQKLRPAAEAFIAERERLDAAMRRFKDDIDRRELASLERREGRKAGWHIKNVMISAEEIVQLLPGSARPVVDLPAFDAALARYAEAVKGLDAFSAENPGSLSSFESQPRSWLGKLREFRQKVGRARGDARRSGGSDLTWIVNDYNMMISGAQMARRFGR